MSKLRLITADQSLPPVPYPSNTLSKGWRFELDLDRAKGSDTWALCPPDIRPWLLMLWAESWKATPCGSYTNDDQIIAARIGMPINLFRAHRDVLMRGWELHADGRLYHHVVTERVRELLGMRQSARFRKAAYRSKKKQPVAPESPEVVPRDYHRIPVGETPLELELELERIKEKENTLSATPTGGSELELTGDPPKTQSKNRKSTTQPLALPGFEQFWKAYPHYQGRSSKKDSVRIWMDLKLEGIADRVITTVKNYRKTSDWTRDAGQYVPAAEVWLKRVQWEQEAPAAPEDEPRSFVAPA
jgi:hypothetical protein